MTPMLLKMAEAFQADLREQGKLYEIGGGPDPQRLMLYTGECADLPRALRAALLAIREPDDKMLRAAFAEMNRTPGRTWKQMKADNKSEREIFDAKARPRHTAMIDAIIADKPEGGA